MWWMAVASGCGGSGAPLAAPAYAALARALDAVGPVNLEDFAILAHEWLATQKPLFADLNNDKVINLADLTLLANNWLTSCPRARGT